MKRRQIKKDRAIIAAYIAAGQNPPEKTVARLMKDKRFLSLDDGTAAKPFDEYARELFKHFRA